MDRNISNWGWGSLLELPDHLFGRRFSVGCYVTIPTGGSGYDVSEMALPEKAVIWEMCICASNASADFGSISMALGDQLPADDAAFNRMEQLFPDLGRSVGTRRDIYVFRNCACSLSRLKVGIDTQGRRLVLRYHQIAGELAFAEVGLVVSSVPRSLPEWFG
jgi:hypothetical protein